MLRSWCKSSFYLVKNYPGPVQFNLNFSEYEKADDPVIAQIDDKLQHPILMEKWIDGYDFDRSNCNIEPCDQNPFVSLANNNEYEWHNPRHGYCYNERPSITFNLSVPDKSLSGISYSTEVHVIGFFFNVGAPQSVTYVNQLLAYLRKYH